MWLRSLRVWVCACESVWELAGVKCMCKRVPCQYISVQVHAIVHALLFVCKISWAPGQGDGLILCGLKRINFVLTLAGCGLHPHPPLFCLPEARQRRRQASRDGEVEEARGWRRDRVAKKCYFRKGFFVSSSLHLQFMSWCCCKSSSNMCVVSVFEIVCMCLSGPHWVFLFSLPRGNLFT